ncbi:MAG: tRNA pseudouridine(55) synthase TruB [Oscillospiraceae bacterium]|nr:tRNA pseudouridine(55) synthase TruB [Oscillospiraceae bacterium]
MTSLNESLNGIICMNKPADFTSFDVIAKMRGILRLKRLGHAGTLDPMATGVLPVFVGKATKACDIIPNHDKTYEAEFQLGLSSDTQDIYGKITDKKDASGVTSVGIENVLDGFRGDIMQLPPMYSAVMVNGQRLYDLARQGIVAEREMRPVTIHSLILREYDEKSHMGRLEISCSRGTYIRTLINDIGEALGCGGIMTSLVRTRACGFGLADCVTIEDLQELADKGISAERYLIPIENAFEDYKRVRLNPHQERLYRSGVRLDTDKMRISGSGKFRVYGANGDFIGIAGVNPETREFYVEKNF